MERRKAILALAALPALAAGLGRGATPPKRLGVLFLGDEKTVMTGYDAKPYESLGWYEGKTLVKIRKYADWDEKRLDPLARQLTAARPDVLFTAGVPATRALQKATRTIPIFTVVDDPVGNGFAQSLARPGGNITGLSEGSEVCADRQVALVRSVMPRVKAIRILSQTFEPAYLMEASTTFVKAAHKAGLTVDAAKFTSNNEAEALLRKLPPQGESAVYLRWVGESPAAALMQVAIPRKVAVFAQEEELADHGVLMTLRMVVAEEKQFMAAMDRVLRGANPAVTPFELPSQTVFAINRRTAAAIGVTFPQELVLRADKVVG